MIFESIVKFAIKCVKFLFEYFSEEEKRGYTRQIRNAKIRWYSSLETVEKLQKSNIRKRSLLEIRRRRALKIYLNAEYDFLLKLQKILNDAKQKAFAKINELDKLVKRKTQKNYISFEIWNEYKLQKNRVHDGIANFKQFEKMVVTRLRSLKEQVHSIPKEGLALGSKKKIQALIESINKDFLKEYRGKGINSLNEINFSEYSFSFDVRCKSCGIRLSQNMKFCFGCGEGTGSEIKLKFFKKYVSADRYKCSECNAPFDPEFRYCYSCGRELDAFGFHELIGK